MDDDNDNIIFQDEPGIDFEFKYNFVTIPWDDRTTKSKIGIISLLSIIFILITACVTHNMLTHFGTSKAEDGISSIKCNLVKVEEYKFAARIHSIDTQELLCVGVVVSTTSVLANGVCVKAGSIRLRLGSPFDPRCKKGFSVDVVEPIHHEGTVSKQVVLLSSYENIAECAKVIQIGDTIDWDATAYIIGRPVRGGRSLSRQPVKLARIEGLTGFAMRNLNMRDTICVKDLGKCPVRAGDLLIQGGRVFGLAATSTHVAEQSNMACFADLRKVTQELEEHDEDIRAQKNI